MKSGHTYSEKDLAVLDDEDRVFEIEGHGLEAGQNVLSDESVCVKELEVPDNGVLMKGAVTLRQIRISDDEADGEAGGRHAAFRQVHGDS